jgi:hypothetical protein
MIIAIINGPNQSIPSTLYSNERLKSIPFQEYQEQLNREMVFYRAGTPLLSVD